MGRKTICGQLMRAFGGVIPVTLRDRYREFSGGGGKLYIRYDEVHDWPKFQQLVIEHEDVAWADSSEGVTIWEEEGDEV